MMRIAIIRKYRVIIILTFAVIAIAGSVYFWHAAKPDVQPFDGERAFSDVKFQVGLGPRTMDSAAHEAAFQWISDNLNKAGWHVEIQNIHFDYVAGSVGPSTVNNIIAKRGSGTPWVIIGSHYDSRAMADRDPNPDNRNKPVPGANDGASTVAILLELARVIPQDTGKQIWLVFFDNEDNGNSSGTGWDVGSVNFVSQLHGKPDSVVILDMLGDKDLNIYMEKNSDPQLNAEIWGVAKKLGYKQFIPEYKYALIDDHTPFIQAGIPAVDVIDFDYPYWHTTQDTLDKISARSLKIAGDTILKWLEQYPK